MTSSNTATLEFSQMTKLLKIVNRVKDGAIYSNLLLVTQWVRKMELSEYKFELIDFIKADAFKLPYIHRCTKNFMESNNARHLGVVVNNLR